MHYLRLPTITEPRVCTLYQTFQPWPSCRVVNAWFDGTMFPTSSFSSLQYYQTCSLLLPLSIGENLVASLPNSIPKHGAKIDTDPHTFGRIYSQGI